MHHAAAPPDIETATPAYARRFAGPAGAYMLEVQNEGVRRLLSALPLEGRRVLDVGGGHAQLTPLLLARGAEVWVQGSAPSCAERLASFVGEAEGRLRFVTSSLLVLPFADRTFDLVIGIRLLAHVERWQALLTEMARVSRGSMLVDYPPTKSANALEPFLYPVKRVVEHDTRRFACFSISEIAPVLRDLGFVDLAERRQFLMPMMVHRVLKRPRLSRWVEAWGERLGLTTTLGSPALLMAQRPDSCAPASRRPSDRLRRGDHPAAPDVGGSQRGDRSPADRAMAMRAHDQINRQSEGTPGWVRL